MSSPKLAYPVELVSPFPEYNLPMVWDWITQFRKNVADDFGPQTLDEFVEIKQATADTEMTWGVVRNGEFGGIISFQPINGVTGYAHALFKKPFWGRATTMPAMKQVAREIFSRGYQKIAMTPFEDNAAIRSLLHDLGAHQEGIMRHQSLRQGKPVSIVHYGLFPDDIKEG